MRCAYFYCNCGIFGHCLGEVVPPAPPNPLKLGSVSYSASLACLLSVAAWCYDRWGKIMKHTKDHKRNTLKSSLAGKGVKRTRGGRGSCVGYSSLSRLLHVACPVPSLCLAIFCLFVGLSACHSSACVLCNVMCCNVM